MVRVGLGSRRRPGWGALCISGGQEAEMGWSRRQPMPCLVSRDLVLRQGSGRVVHRDEEDLLVLAGSGPHRGPGSSDVDPANLVAGVDDDACPGHRVLIMLREHELYPAHRPKK